MIRLTWEPSAAQLLKGTHAVYPHLNDFTGKLIFCYKNQNQTKNIPVGLPSSPIKIWGKSVRGSWVMIGQTNKQKDKQRLNFIYRRYDHSTFLVYSESSGGS